MSASAAPGAPAGASVALPRPSTVRRVSFFGFGALVVLGVVFYLWWGLAFGVWVDNGVYAVVAVLVLFGLSGMWLVLPSPPAPAPPRPRSP